MTLIRRTGMAGRRAVDWRREPIPIDTDCHPCSLLCGAQARRHASEAAALAAAEFRAAFAWQGPPAVVALDGNHVVGAGWTYAGRDEIDLFQTVIKLDILIASSHRLRGLGRAILYATLAEAEREAASTGCPIRISVERACVERWLAAAGLAQVAESEDGDLTFWEKP